jgi:hypothetical protein
MTSRNTFFTFCSYATTLITSKVFNPEDSAREIFLTVILPETAFISRYGTIPAEQGCQIFLGPSIPKREKYTK